MKHPFNLTLAVPLTRLCEQAAEAIRAAVKPEQYAPTAAELEAVAYPLFNAVQVLHVESGRARLLPTYGLLYDAAYNRNSGCEDDPLVIAADMQYKAADDARIAPGASDAELNRRAFAAYCAGLALRAAADLPVADRVRIYNAEWDRAHTVYCDYSA